MMAYAVYEEVQLKNPKSIQYYPQEYDYPEDFNKGPTAKPNYLPIQNTLKKPKKATVSVNYVNEKKCPIYVHEYNKSPISSTYNNYSSVKTLNKTVTDKNALPKTKKNQNSHLSKSMLDQLEESYWAQWKPNKENNINRPKKVKGNEDRSYKNKAYGDASETLVKYFETADFNTSAMSVIEHSRSGFKQQLELISNPIIHDVDTYSQKLVITSTQEIQTEGYPLILPKIDEHVESNTTVEKNESSEDSIDINAIKSEDIVLQYARELEKSDIEDEPNLLKHTDSLIITKKKQSEIKEHFQQPRCIKLYKKPGTSTSFLRGGSYPLKSCLKREPVQRGSFKLGAPGSPILVTTNSCPRKSRK